MEIKRYRNIIIILAIILVFSTWYCYNTVQLYRQNQVVSVSVDTVLKDIRSLNNINNLEHEHDSNNKETRNIRIPLSDFSRYNFEENYKQMISDKNIFGLIKKIDLKEDNPGKIPENDLEEVENMEKKIVNNTMIDNKQKEENKPEPFLNPFFIQAVSINEYDKMAVIVNKENLESYIVKAGEIVDGYLVKSVEHDRIIMEKNNREISVIFEY